MLKAYHLPGRWGLPSVSPFCLKLDAVLRMAHVEHQSLTASTPFGGPKKKAPWIEHDGRKIGDSSLIIDYLKDRFAVDIDAHLTEEERGLATATGRMVEENLYWAMVYDRWQRPENWPILKQSVLGDIPAPARAIIAPIARRGVAKQLQGHGMGLHSPQEIEAIAQRDITALAAILGNKDWFFGGAPGLADATVYSLLANILHVPFDSPMKDMITQHPALPAFVDRFRAKVYPDAG
ncbi:glutathione S-transferase family protein [Qipengyuania sp. DSG2-2]|uniref:glutathione S-transferase family protein n=1 Tax=Qipengyuania sp. DGS2-2 TaxID=3349631 RepID=UPI0036D340CE